MPSHTRIQQQGFTLIEMMIVVAIISILSAVAIPAYQNYTRRAHVSEGLNIVSGAKASVSEYYASEGHWPTSNAMAGFDNTQLTGSALKSIDIQQDGSILITYNSKVANGAKLMLKPTPTGSAIQWTCAAVPGSGMKINYLPSHCRNTTTITSEPP